MKVKLTAELVWEVQPSDEPRAKWLLASQDSTAIHDSLEDARRQEFIGLQYRAEEV